jgi:endonuclease/exonuclease/phosphatase family metal-dependent hydrolase
MVPVPYRRPRTVLTIANFNMHCGIDGWGRPFDYVSVIGSLEADVIVLEETWAAGRDGQNEQPGQAQEAARSLGYQVVAQTMGEGYRIGPRDDANEHWMPRQAFADHNKSLYFDCLRAIRPATLELPRFKESERGRFGMAVLVRPDYPIEDRRILSLPTLKRDRVRRCVIVVDLTVEGRPISVAGTHMAHLYQGSPKHYRLIGQRLKAEARPDAVLSGDMNLWGPGVRLLLPGGWHRAVRGASWPTEHPHSQIDHILVRGALQPVSGKVFGDSGSDHRPIRAEISLG